MMATDSHHTIIYANIQVASIHVRRQALMHGFRMLLFLIGLIWCIQMKNKTNEKKLPTFCDSDAFYDRIFYWKIDWSINAIFLFQNARAPEWTCVVCKCFVLFGKLILYLANEQIPLIKCLNHKKVSPNSYNRSNEKIDMVILAVTNSTMWTT